MTKDKFIFGAIKDPVDSRDFVASTVRQQKVNIPTKYLVPHLDEIPVYNQGGTGSCVAHALATALALGYAQKGIQIDFSRGFIYGNRDEDEYQGVGMIPREALKHLNHDGDVHYSDFVYNFEVPLIFKRFQKEKERLLPIAKDYVIANYYKVTTQIEIKTALMTTGAVVMYCPVFGDFTDDLKAEWRDTYEGAHEVCLVGWDETGWIIRNSWGENWGNKGNGHIDYKYGCSEELGVTYLDFWAITPYIVEDIEEDPEETEEENLPVIEEEIDNNENNEIDSNEDVIEDDDNIEEDKELEEEIEQEEVIEDDTKSDDNIEDTNEDNNEDVDVDYEEEEVNEDDDIEEQEEQTEVDTDTDIDTDNKEELLINDRRFISFVEAIKTIIKQILNRIRNIFNGNK